MDNIQSGLLGFWDQLVISRVDILTHSVERIIST